MRVLLRLNAIGPGAYSSRDRRGIHRYEVRLVAALARELGHPVDVCVQDHLEPRIGAAMDLPKLLPGAAVLVNRLPASLERLHAYHGWIHDLRSRFPRWHPRRLIPVLTWRLLHSMIPDRRLSGSWDVVHSSWAPLPDGVTARARVLTVHDALPATHPHWTGASASSEWRRAVAGLDPVRDRALCVSAFTRGELCAATGFPGSACTVIHLGVEDRFHPQADPQERVRLAERYRLPLAARWLSCIAALEPRKNLPLLLRILPEILAEHPDVVAVLAGPEGDASAELAQAALAFPGRVILAGYLDDADLPAFYRQCAVYLHPALHEGFGLPPLEAMACATPVVASSAGAMPEVLGGKALLLSPTDPAAWTAIVCRVLGEPVLARQVSSDGVERARGFTWARMGAETAELYRSCLARA